MFFTNDQIAMPHNGRQSVRPRQELPSLCVTLEQVRCTWPMMSPVHSSGIHQGSGHGSYGRSRWSWLQSTQIQRSHQRTWQSVWLWGGQTVAARRVLGMKLQ